jgi:hypothetical protein
LEKEVMNQNSKYAFCKVSVSPIRREKRDASEMISQLLFGEPVEIIEIDYPWIKIQSLIDGYEGYIDKKQVVSISPKELKKWIYEYEREICLFSDIQTPWGRQTICAGSFTSNEVHFNIGEFTFQRKHTFESLNQDIYSYANSFLNTPYLWGGKNILGIDCSGFSQIVFSVFGKKLPRDAYQQADIGFSVEFINKKSGDLAFFCNENGKIIHVGIVGPDNKIIHASGLVRIDDFKPDGIYIENTQSKTHNLYSIKRID